MCRRLPEAGGRSPFATTPLSALAGCRRALRSFAGLFMLLVSTPALQAQLAESDTLPWHVELSASFFLSSGNVDRVLWRTDATLKHATEAWGIASSSTYLFGSFGGNATERDLLARNFVYLLPKERLYPYLMFWLQTHKRRRIDWRYQLGPGVTLVARRTASEIVKLSATVTYEQTELQGHPLVVPSDPDLWRLTGRLFAAQSLFSGRLQVRYELWHQVALQDGGDHRWFADVSLRVPLQTWLSLRSDASATRESRVLPGVRRRDLYWTFGVTVGK